MTEKQIVEETVKFYLSNPRSIDVDINTCLYRGPNRIRRFFGN